MKNLSKCQEMMTMQQESYWIICINAVDLSIQTNMSILQQVNFAGKLEENDGAAMVFISLKQQKTILNFSLDSFIIAKYK